MLKPRRRARLHTDPALKAEKSDLPRRHCPSQPSAGPPKQSVLTTARLLRSLKIARVDIPNSARAPIARQAPEARPLCLNLQPNSFTTLDDQDAPVLRGLKIAPIDIPKSAWSAYRAVGSSQFGAQLFLPTPLRKQSRVDLKSLRNPGATRQRDFSDG
jgi:hypothetical protein